MSAAPVGSGRPAAIGASSPALPVTSIPDPPRCEVSFASFPVIFQWTFAPHMTRSPLASVSWAPFTMPAYFCVTKMDFVPCPHPALSRRWAATAATGAKMAAFIPPGWTGAWPKGQLHSAVGCWGSGGRRGQASQSRLSVAVESRLVERRESHSQTDCMCECMRRWR